MYRLEDVPALVLLKHKMTVIVHMNIVSYDLLGDSKVSFKIFLHETVQRVSLYHLLNQIWKPWR